MKGTLIKIRKKRGFVLPIILIAISGILLLTTRSLYISQTTLKATSASNGSYPLNLALESAKADAISTLVHATNRDQFITHQKEDAEGEPEYYLISWFDPDSSNWNHQPLFSGAKIQTIAPPQNTTDGYSQYNPNPDLGTALIEMTDLRTRFSSDQKTSFLAPRVSLFDDTSYSYWIEDLNGLLDYEALTHKGNDPATSFDPNLSTKEHERRAEMKILDQRHIGINSFSSLEIGKHEYPIDFNKPFDRRLVSNTGDSSAPAPPHHTLKPIFDKDLVSYSLTPEIIVSELNDTLPSEYDDLGKFFTIGLPGSRELEIIPYGYDYTNAGEIKANLNDYLSLPTEQAVEKLSHQIKQVRGFKDNPKEYETIGITVDPDYPINSRYGGFPVIEESYCKTLAANIIDYADVDSSSTSTREEERRYRGIDAMPLLSEMARRYVYSDSLSDGNGGISGVVIQIRTFIEIWNPTNQPIQGYIKYKFLPDSSHEVTIDETSYPLPEETLYYWGGLISLAPNEYKVLEVTTDNNGDFIGEFGIDGYPAYEIPTSSTQIKIRRENAEFSNRCKLYWFSSNNESPPPSDTNFTEVCGFNSPFTIENGFIRLSHLYANFSAVGIINSANMVADARNNFYIRSVNEHRAINYRQNSTFGGPNYYQTYTSLGGRLNPQEKFSDGAYNNTFLGSDPPGSDNGTNSEYLPGEYGYVHMNDPEGVKKTTGFDENAEYHTQAEKEQQRYIQTISNKGYFTSLGELGHIFDPAQWLEPKRRVSYNNDENPDDTDDSQNFSPKLSKDYDQYGQSLPAHPIGSSTESTLSEFGGGITLAIGCPEINVFDPYSDPDYSHTEMGGRKGYESARLLDQFRTTESPLRSLKSRININTAPKQVLTALFSGFTHERDLIINEGESFTRQPQRIADNTISSTLTAGIIQHRNKTPFSSLSDIALVRGNVEIEGATEELYLFGEKATYESNAHVGNLSLNAHVWNDSGREELFCRTHDLFTTKSRAYRVHIQAEQKIGTRTRIKKQVFDIIINPKRDPTNNIDGSVSPEITIIPRL